MKNTQMGKIEICWSKIWFLEPEIEKDCDFEDFEDENLVGYNNMYDLKEK